MTTSRCTSSQSSISTYHFNARSIRYKMDEISYFTKQNNIHILTISETWLGPEFSDNYFNLPNFQTVFRQDRNKMVEVAPPPRAKKRSLIFFCAPARGTQQANVLYESSGWSRKRSLIFFCAPARGTQQANSARRQFYSFRRLSVSGLRLTQKSEVSAWTFVEV